MKKILVFVLAFSFVSLSAQKYAQRIYTEGSKLMAGEKEIFLNGTNTPWINWNDFGIGRFKAEAWDREFQLLEDNGVNSTRVWLSCNGEDNPLQISETGYVNGPTQSFWDDLDALAEIAEKHRVYLMAALISFDHTIVSNPHSDRWRAMYGSAENMNSFVENYAVSVAKRYNDNPYFFAMDVCNEILWVSQDEKNDRGNFPWSTIQYLVGKTAQRVHEESDVLVCVSNYIKYTSPSYNGNKYSDAALQAQVNDPDAYVDFYKIHYYSWVHSWFGGFHFDNSPDHFGIGEKPCITGEIKADGGYNNSNKLVYTTTQYFEKHLENGWVGCMPWTSNGVDSNGDIFGPHGTATRAFRDNHDSLVYPLGKPCTINPEKTNLIFKSSNPGIRHIDVVSDSIFEVITGASWINASFYDDLLKVEVTANASMEKRMDTILLSGCQTRKIVVSQFGAVAPDEDALFMRAYPLKAQAGDDIIVRLDYAVTGDADKVRVDLFKDFINWNWFSGDQLDILTPASGSYDFTLNIPESLPAGKYKLFANVKNGDRDVITQDSEIEVFDSLPAAETDSIRIAESPLSGIPGEDMLVIVDFQDTSVSGILRVDIYDNLTDNNWITGAYIDITSAINSSYAFLIRAPSSLADGNYMVVASLKKGESLLSQDVSDISIERPVINVSGVSINNCPVEHLEVGESFYLNQTIEPANASDNSVTWSSSADTIAIVSSFGHVKAVGKGIVTISLKTTDGDFTDQCVVVIDNAVGLPVHKTVDRIKIYPNPAKGSSLHLSNLEAGSIIRMISMTGSLLYRNIAKGRHEVLNIEAFKKGLYFLMVGSDAYKVIIE